MRLGISFDEFAVVVQIISGHRDNFWIIIHTLPKNIFCDPIRIKTILMRGHNICFYREIRKLYSNYPQYPFLSGGLISSVTGLLHDRIMTSNIQEYLSLNER